MPSYNEITIIGHVGRDAELRFTPNKTPVTNFTVAVNRKYKKNSGEEVTTTEWFNVVTWSKIAENCKKYVNKGDLVMVTGSAHLHTFESKEGKTLSSIQINSKSVLFLNSKDNNPKYDVPPDVEYAEDYSDEDVPF